MQGAAAVLIRPLPFGHPDRLFTMTLVNRDGDVRNLPLPLCDDFAAHLKSVERLAAAEFEEYGLQEVDWQAVSAAAVTANFFDVLDLRFAVGRPFIASDEISSERAVVLSDRIWRRVFAADPAIVGRRVRLSHRLSEASALYTVVGVADGTISAPNGRDVAVFIVVPRDDPAHLWWAVPSRYVVGRVASQRSFHDVSVEANARVRNRVTELAAYQLAGVAVEGLRDRQVKSWRHERDANRPHARPTSRCLSCSAGTPPAHRRHFAGAS